ncbi:DUF397 domain-containing protein [Micromonospora sp. 067-2]|uniref:DUF397 domain-containing protein n=1 Tax=Micromonospora sp. 067-2 TaxID=2789270 RepID=UPI00397C3CF8
MTSVIDSAFCDVGGVRGVRTARRPGSRVGRDYRGEAQPRKRSSRVAGGVTEPNPARCTAASARSVARWISSAARSLRYSPSRRNFALRAFQLAWVLPGVVLVRDTKNRDGGTLILDAAAWRALVTQVAGRP